MSEIRGRVVWETHPQNTLARESCLLFWNDLFSMLRKPLLGADMTAHQPSSQLDTALLIKIH